jgi:hypothetical protein
MFGNQVNINLSKWDMNNIRFHRDENKGPVIVMIGRRDTGKSYLVNDLMSYQTSIPVGTVISGTEAGNGFYKPIVPKMFIHHEYTSTILENVLRRQQCVVKHYQKEVITLPNGQKNCSKVTCDPRCFLIMDDCLYDDKWCRDKLMRMVFMNGRHWKMMLVITMQYPLGVPPVLRTNIDYVFILREPIMTNRKRIWENYASMFPTFEAFNMVLDQTTEDYHCLVINNNAKSSKLFDQVFWYKASSRRPPYRLCAKEHWDFSATIPDDDDDGEAEYDPNSYRKKGAGPSFVVRKN